MPTPSAVPSSVEPGVWEQAIAKPTQAAYWMSWRGAGAIGGLLLGIVGLRLATRRRSASRAPAGVVPEPGPGVLGPGSPALSDGLIGCAVSPGDLQALIGPLLATLAEHHRVVVAAPAGQVLPRVEGGPVYRVSDHRAAEIRAVAEALQTGNAHVAVLSIGLGVADYTSLAAALPNDIGGVALCTSPEGLPPLRSISVRSDGEAWMVQTGTESWQVALTPRGVLRPV